MLSQQQRGFTLLESLIAIVVVALGVLGILGVQLRTLQETQTSVRRAQAIRLIEDLNERIRANPNALTAGVLANYAVDWGAVAFTPPDCAAAACGSGDLALYDIATWKAAVTATMPLGDASVFVVNDTTGLNTRAQLGIMIAWRANERAGADAAEDTEYRVPFTLGNIGTNAAGTAVRCPDRRICHLQYVQPTLRCLPYVAGGAANPPALCP